MKSVFVIHNSKQWYKGVQIRPWGWTWPALDAHWAEQTHPQTIFTKIYFIFYFSVSWLFTFVWRHGERDDESAPIIEGSTCAKLKIKKFCQLYSNFTPFFSWDNGFSLWWPQGEMCIRCSTRFSLFSPLKKMLQKWSINQNILWAIKHYQSINYLN